MAAVVKSVDGLPAAAPEENECAKNFHGCGPASYATSSVVSLTWGTHPTPVASFPCYQPCLPGYGAVPEPCCGGPLPVPAKLPPWLSKEDLDQILDIGKPYGDVQWCQAEFCGDPWCDSQFSKNLENNEPLLALRKRLPHLDFKLRADWRGCDKGANWKHILEVRQKTDILGQPQIPSTEDAPVEVAA
jgi:hypothetical protein